MTQTVEEKVARDEVYDFFAEHQVCATCGSEDRYELIAETLRNEIRCVDCGHQGMLTAKDAAVSITFAMHKTQNIFF
ncbi:MAG: hypothetical protein WCG31_05340 [Deltaproteobacteria bacterium]